MKDQRITIKKVFAYVGAYKWIVLVSILLAAISVALTLCVPRLIGLAIDCIVGKGQVDFTSLIRLLMLIGASCIGVAVCQWVQNALNNRAACSIVRDIRNDAFKKLEKLPLSYFDTHAAGETVNRIITDAETFADGLLMTLTQFFTGALTILGTIGFMVAIHPAIAAVVVVLTPLSLLVASFIAKRTSTMFRTQSEVRGKQTAQIDEMIGEQKLVQAFGYEKRAEEDFNAVNEKLRSVSLRAIFFSSLTNPCTRFVNSLVYAAVTLVGALSVISGGGAAGALTVGALTTLLAYANQYTNPFNEISGVVTELQNALTCAARVFELMEETEEISEPADAVELSDVKGQVEIRNVSFSYVPEKPLIEGFNLSVEPGKRVAIVGPTGCGKTTFINLLQRFYDVNGGSITVDGHDIRNVTRESLRASWGMVLQETWLRHGTVRENITMGKPDATDEEIVAAAKATHAHSFICRLPRGYDTVLSEDGGGLSQGQKQLLCITRVMLCLPPMLILDEATSSIDTKTELRIQRAFAKLMQGRTSFIVAHRLSTVREADVILVMQSGKIIEIGDHETLLQKGGFYKKLYESQFAK